jgi:hypothetical protein
MASRSATASSLVAYYSEMLVGATLDQLRMLIPSFSQ